MRMRILTLLVLLICINPVLRASGPNEDDRLLTEDLSGFFEIIDRETKKIEQLSNSSNLALAEAFCSRAESYLILNCNEEALDDFSKAYEYSSTEESETGKLLVARALFGSFFSYARLEDLENSQSLFEILSEWIDSYCSCIKYTSLSDRNRVKRCSLQEEPNYPVLGPDKATTQECLDRVEGAVLQLNLLIAAVKSAPIRTMALTLIKQIAREAERCCYAGGLWKGCLQKLVNKLHYWNKGGIPMDPSYYTGIQFM